MKDGMEAFGMGYEFNPDDARDFARTLTTEYHEHGDELFFKYCPYCNGGNRDKRTFSINLKHGAFNCFRSSCGKQGHFVELARDFNYRLDFKDNSQPRVYKTIPQKDFETRQAALDYLESRGISREIGLKYKITTQKQHENVLVFPFYDHNGVLRFLKYRNTKYSGNGSKEWAEKGTMPILFGMNHCIGFDRLVITEGQIDSLSLAECGIENAVSVPNGAMGFTWVDNVWDWIAQFREIVVFGDNEHGKMTLLDTLQKRMTCTVKAVQLEDYLGEKDANDILRKYGKDAVVTAVSRAKIPPLPNVKELAGVDAVDIYNLPRIYTNIPEIDRVIGGLFFGQVILLTGKRGDGKSTFMSQLMLEAVEQNYNVFAYSGELTDYHFKNWFDLQAAGPGHVTERLNQWQDKVYFLEHGTVEKINNWYRGKAYIYNNSYTGDDSSELEELTATAEKVIQRYGVKLVCVDNLMTALDVGMSDDLYRAQGAFVKKLKWLAMKYNAAVVLVAHPRKAPLESSVNDYNDNVSGSADITNRVDVVMTYSRNNSKEISCDSLLSITKNRLTGVLAYKDKAIQLDYSESSKRITTTSSYGKAYGWEKMKEAEEWLNDEDNNPFV